MIRLPLGFLIAHQMIKKLAIALFFVLAFSINCFSQTSDWKAWAGIELKRDLRKGFDIGIQAQTRLENDFQHFRGNYFSFSASYKLRKHLFLQAEGRYATSRQWDKFRPGLAIEWKDKFGKIGLSAKLRYQYEFYLQSIPEIGQYPAQNNLRLKLGADRKLAKHLNGSINIEPLFIVSEHITQLSWVRNTIKLDWEFLKRQHFEFGYFYQPQFNGQVIESNHGIIFNYTYELKRQKKKKKD